MDLMPWRPFQELERMRSTFDRLFSEPMFGLGPSARSAAVLFPAEVMEQNGDVVVRCEMAGIEPKDVEVRITDDGVTFRGERKAEREQQDKETYRSERYYGTFSRSITFPVPVDSKKAKATFKNGVLEVRAPKREPDSERDGRRLEIDTEG